jgi:hypothetical protein
MQEDAADKLDELITLVEVGNELKKTAEFQVSYSVVSHDEIDG